MIASELSVGTVARISLQFETDKKETKRHTARSTHRQIFLHNISDRIAGDNRLKLVVV